MTQRSPEDGHIRALRVLETLAGLQQPASLPTIAEKAQLTRTKAYRVLRGLQEHGFVDHAGHGGYRIGSRAVALATLIGPRPALLQAARPVLTRLAVQTSEVVTLMLRSGAHRVLVLAAEPPGNPERVPVVIGERSPLTSGCSGRAILAFLPEAEEVLLGLVAPLHAACAGLAPRLAAILGPNSSLSLESLDVTIRDETGES
jgi:IclR family transcriptional regulator, acetate operon repressor